MRGTGAGMLVEVQDTSGYSGVVAGGAVYQPGATIGMISTKGFLQWRYNNIVGTNGGLAWIDNSSQVDYNASPDARIWSPAANSYAFGLDDSATPIPQKISVQNVASGTTDATGSAFTIAGSRGTGAGKGGAIIFQIAAPSGSSGTAVNPLVTVATIDTNSLVVTGSITATLGTFVRDYTFVLGAGTPVTVGVNKTNVLIVTHNGVIKSSFAAAKTGPTGASLLFDIYKNGVSIWNVTQANRLAIASGATTGTQTSFDTITLSQGDQLTIDIDQVGSSVSGQDITVVLSCLLSNI